MQSDNHTFLEDLIHTSIYLNELLIPLNSVETTLARYTQQLVAVNDCDDFPISLAASCITVRYRGRFFILCTSHQLVGWEKEDFALLTKDGKFCITSGGASYFEDTYEADYHDLAAFDFTKPCLAKPELQEMFFNLKEFPQDTMSDQIVCLVVSGYPFCEQIYDMANGRKLGAVKRTIVCNIAELSKQSKVDQSLLCLEPIDRLCFEPNGISGGPAFVIQMVQEEPRVYFAGIITRAGTNNIHIVHNGYIQNLLDGWIDS